ncbi:glycerate kinase [Corynebacterium minutissimum]|uniref:Glycerate kinase n=1 Tax=Corynebacterium minutissimum TaxID=38301 RepID=A0A2X4RCD2_9CORY|nr:glycerate kinase [Corynebacterium minutissimum]KHO29233.1 glycerate kinase [Corynebacterium minutissimum]QPS59235.1 glycerate kinase [Corynebacterium minutissimum]QQA79976.1 glycerate kinase [Corynebacterium minutissimum]SQH99533.1 glycerate kinase [Corynebacterium minutissimum]VEG06348.1 glycerate kinase [Corynebacterium minutissimum]
MRILVAPDSFKGTATANEAAAAIALGARRALNSAGLSATSTVTTLPMADGGEGTAEVLASAAVARTGSTGQTITLPTTDAVGRLTEASYYLVGEEAFIDVAAATGLPAVSDALDPLHADSYGTGVLIADAEARGAKHIVLGLGGSVSIDGGLGILTALGAAAHDARGYALPKGGAPLVTLNTIDTAQLNMKAALLDYTLVTDTRAVPIQAATMYGPQKGAEGEQVALLAGAMLQLCAVTDTNPQAEFMGAAGGIPIALSWLSRTLWGTDEHCRIVPGGRYVAEALNLPTLAAEADLLITGEGRFDEQSLTGKVVGTLAELTEEAAGSPTLGIVAGSATAPAPAGALLQELESDGSNATSSEVAAAISSAAERLVTEFIEASVPDARG